MKKKIYQKIIFDINNFFLIVLVSIGSIIWVIQAVNFLDFIAEDGHGFRIYFYYTLLNFPKIIAAILPFIFFISLFYVLIKYENNNELLIFWTNGITKENFTKTMVKFSLIYLIIQILLTTIIVPKSQNLARSFIRSSNIDFFPALLKEKKFIDTVEGLTIFIDRKNRDGTMYNIFLKDQLNKNKSQIIYAKKGNLNISDDSNFLIFE
jgi:lipopolysaccharide export system permease protein